MPSAKITFNTVAREICKREKSEHREVNITDVKRVMRHFLDILGEYPLIQQATNGDNDDGQWELGLQMGAGISFVAAETSKRQNKRIKALMDKSQKRPTGKGR